MPDYDAASLDAHAQGAARTGQARRRASTTPFGAESEVDPVRHLIGTAAGWGGLPDREARYVSVDPGTSRRRVQAHGATTCPVDGFWSISVYNADGFFEPNDRDAYSVNNITATPERRRLDHRPLRRLRRRPAQLPADHRRLELHRPALPTPRRGPRRLLDVPIDRTGLTRHRVRRFRGHSGTLAQARVRYGSDDESISATASRSTTTGRGRTTRRDHLGRALRQRRCPAVRVRASQSRTARKASGGVALERRSPAAARR